MTSPLPDISAAVSEGRHALVVFDGAGRRRSKELRCPDNVSVIRLLPYSPELNPAKNLFELLKARQFRQPGV